MTDLSVYLWLALFRKAHKVYIIFFQYQSLQYISNFCDGFAYNIHMLKNYTYEITNMMKIISILIKLVD